tara:strand:+ start:262 stop:1248 length:987 start_codon:yes stop_codon:yes gene_type:complete
MNDSLSNIESVVVRIVTDKPVRKTPYQVKGVFMKQYPDEPIISMVNGTNREKYLYPRVQVKILNEQIFIIGLNEGVEPVLSLKEQIQTLDFGNISFNVVESDSELLKNQFQMTDKLIHYRFITPWVALNQSTGNKFRKIKNQEKIKFLNTLLAQNLIFIIKEFGTVLDEKVYIKVIVPSLFPKAVDEKRWGSFNGEFKTNVFLPSYIGIGNGLTRGYGTIFGMSNPDTFDFDENKPESGEENPGITLIPDEKNVEVLDVSELERQKKHYSKPKRKRKNKRRVYNTNPHQKNIKKKIKNPIGNKDEDDENETDESRFNSTKYHKRQHKI